MIHIAMLLALMVNDARPGCKLVDMARVNMSGAIRYLCTEVIGNRIERSDYILVVISAEYSIFGLSRLVRVKQ